MRVIKIGPVPGGWSVQCGFGAEPALFTSGMRAEQAGRMLAQSLASVGQTVSLVIHDRYDRRAGIIHFGQREAA